MGVLRWPIWKDVHENTLLFCRFMGCSKGKHHWSIQQSGSRGAGAARPADAAPPGVSTGDTSCAALGHRAPGDKGV